MHCRSFSSYFVPCLDLLRRAQAALAPAALAARGCVVAACRELFNLALLVRREPTFVAQIPVFFARWRGLP